MNEVCKFKLCSWVKLNSPFFVNSARVHVEFFKCEYVICVEHICVCCICIYRLMCS